jgi:hypothetical protein
MELHVLFLDGGVNEEWAQSEKPLDLFVIGTMCWNHTFPTEKIMKILHR